jgi:hypothetical protein
VYSTERDSVARIPFILDARVNREVAATPAVQKLEDTATRALPGATVHETLTVPLDARTGPPALDAGTIVGFLGGPDGHVAAVTVAAEPSVSDGVAYVDLTVSDLDRAGTYQGAVDLAPSDEKVGELELSVGVRDAIWWPVLVLILGILPALWQLHWRGAARPGFAIERRRTAAITAFNTAHKRFVAAAEEKPWQAYNATRAFNEAAEKAQTAVEHLASESFDSLNADLVKDADEAIARLDDAAASLRKLGESLPSLERELATIDRLDRIQGLPGPKQPAFAQSASDLLRGTTLDLDELKTTAALVAAAVLLAERWPLLHSDTVRAVERVAQRGNSTEDETLAVAAAKRKLVGAWLSINDAPDAATVAERKLVDHLVAAQMAAAEVAPADAVPAGARAPTLGAPSIPVEVHIPTFAGILAGLPADPERRVRAIDRLVRRGDTLVVVLAGLLALYSGLEALYFGKTFGTWADYLSAFLWGLTAAGALDLIGQALRTRLSPLA